MNDNRVSSNRPAGPLPARAGSAAALDEGGVPWLAARIGVPAFLLAGLAACSAGVRETRAPPAAVTAVVPGTGVTACFDDGGPIVCPPRGQPYSGQDGNDPGPVPRLRDNGDGTVSDLNTGLTWARALAGPLSWRDARSGAARLRTGGHHDWRLPSIKELYTLVDFGRGSFAASAATSVPFLDVGPLDFAYAEGARFFDVQEWSATRYVAGTMDGDAAVFGVNFADGRIKAYPLDQPGSGGALPQRMRARYVRGPAYGVNRLRETGSATVVDGATGLEWQQEDDGIGRAWAAALAYCVALDLGGATDWRLPDAKELHTIVDYTRAPAATGEAALPPPLRASRIEAYYWTSTTLADGPPDDRFGKAAYFAFGRALGWMRLPPGSQKARLLDVHGAGAQRADFKSGDPARHPLGLGPQGDEVRIRNAVRCVRGGRSALRPD
ncbi:MAG: DUF1566 domain-containing protein [Pseudomonadota bacterium]|jgi:hypothetical protein